MNKKLYKLGIMRLNPNLLAGTSLVILQGDFRGVSVKITVYIGRDVDGANEEDL